MDMSILRELALHAIKGTAPANYAVEDVDAAFSGELSKYCGSVNQFLKNQYDIFEILVEAVDTIVPNNVIRTLQIFAEFKQVKQGQKAALSGRYISAWVQESIRTEVSQRKSG